MPLAQFDAAKQRRLYHLARILAQIREDEGITRTELARRLSLSKAAVSEMVKQLLEAQIIEETGKSHTGEVGRRPVKLRLVKDRFNILALDLGGTTLRGAITDLGGAITFCHRESTDVERLFEQLCHCIDLLLDHSQRERVLGIGIGVAGTVEPTTGSVISAPALGKRDWALAKLIGDKYGMPVYLDNDVNLAALGEHWCGAARGRKNAICISVGTGIGAGLILDGQLYRGSHNLAGEIGYFYSGLKMPSKAYDSFGALELRAGGYGIQQRALRLLKQGVTSILHTLVNGGPSKVTSEDVLKAYKQGDTLAKRLITDAATQIGVAVANTIVLLDVDAVVLTGGIIQGAPYILSHVRKAVNLICPPEVRRKVHICRGKLSDKAVLLGATCLVSECQLPLAAALSRSLFTA